MSQIYTQDNVPFEIYQDDSVWLNREIEPLRPVDISWCEQFNAILNFLEKINGGTERKIKQYMERNIINPEYLVEMMSLQHNLLHILKLSERTVSMYAIPFQIRLNKIKQALHQPRILSNYKFLCGLLGLPSDFLNSFGGRLPKRNKK